MAKRNAQGAGSIRERKDGLWEARYTVGRNPATGKQVRKSVYGKTQQEADAEDQGQVFRFGQRGANLRADGRHGLLRAQGEQAHAED